ncbi:MAG: adenosylcobinamide amidohydrolase [Desulfosoma sp.]|uniref:adenosylcobinamide amidohydrolase n=1 Tax=Desulfosoma sp. TaxID=2603217 RepID=UPI00404B78A6
MLVEKPYDGLEIHREDKMIYAKFTAAHWVLSTCRAAGGLRHDLKYVYNHQSCEPSGHYHKHAARLWHDPGAYRQHICNAYGLPAEACATMGTAANMHHAAFAQEGFRGLLVAVVCTGGVEANAGRAGDPASVFETPDGFEKLPPAEDVPRPGTINTMIFINHPLIPGAMVQAIMTATEAKTAALQELAVNSRYSDGPATGTGTDQIVLAAKQTDAKPLTGAGKHVKLGELIGRTVLAAVKEALANQNRLTPAGQCSAKIHLERFGINRSGMIAAICRHLSPDQATLLRHNFTGIERDPLTVAAVAAIAHLKDKFAWGILPAACWNEVMANYAAQIACAVCGDFNKLGDFRQTLAPAKTDINNKAFVDLVCRAIALGFSHKWVHFCDSI